MQFVEGQIVVYPHHGPATVTAVTARQIKGAAVDYVELSVHGSPLAVSVPVDNAEAIGVRNVMDEAALSALLDQMRAPTEAEEVSWARRYKSNAEKLKTGDIYAYARVVRDLIRRDTAKGLSLGERDMLRYAKAPLLTEIALSLHIGTGEAEAVIDEVMAGPVPAASAAA